MTINAYRNMVLVLASWFISSASIGQPVTRESLAHAEMLRAQAMAGSNAMACARSISA